MHSHSFVLLWQTIYQIDKTAHKLYQAIDYPASSNVKWHSTSVCFVFFTLWFFFYIIILVTYCWYSFIKLSLLFLFKLSLYIRTEQQCLPPCITPQSHGWMQNHGIYILSNFHHMFAIPGFYTSDSMNMDCSWQNCMEYVELYEHNQQP